MFAEITHKRGDTFEALLTMPSSFPDGYFVGWTATSEMRRTNGALIQAFSVEWRAPEANTRVLALTSDATASWPLGVHEVDVQFIRTSDGRKLSTKTFRVDVLKEVTVEVAGP